MQPRPGRSIVLGRILCLTVVAISVLNGVGWATGTIALVRILPSLPVMPPISAVLLAVLALAAMAAISTRRGWHYASIAGASFTLAVSIGVLIEYATKSGPALGVWLFSDAVLEVPSDNPGRPSPQTMMAIGLLSVAVMNLRTAKPALQRLRALLMVVAGVTVVAVSVGFLFSAVELFEFEFNTGMSLLSVIALAILGCAIAALRPDGPPMTWLRHRNNRNTVVWLLLLTFGLPIAFRLGELLADGLDLRSTDAVAVLFSMAVLGVGVVAIAAAQNRRETRANQLIQAGRDRARTLMDALSDGFCSLNLDGTAITWNPAATRLAGRLESGENLLARIRLDVRDEDGVRIRTPDILHRLRDGHEVRDKAASLQVEPVGSIPISLLLFPISEGGRIVGFGAMFRDNSAEVEAERSIRRLARAVDASADAIYVTDPAGRIEYVNTAFTNITGWSLDEAGGMDPRTLQSDFNDPVTYDEMVKSLERGEVWSGRLLLHRRRSAPPTLGAENSGVEFGDFWAQSTVAPYFDADGELLGYVALQRDVTELVNRDLRQQSEAWAALLRAEIGNAMQVEAPLSRRISSALELLAQGLVSLGGDHWTTLLRIRKSASTVITSTGGSSTEVAEIERCVGLPLGAVRELIQFGPDPDSGAMGLAIPVSGDAAMDGCLVVYSAGEFSSDSVVRDSLVAVTQTLALSIAGDWARTAAEAARDAAQEAAETKSQFLATMSHEIRTPMNGVLGMLEMLTFTDLDVRQRELVGVAESSAESLLTIINDILDFSKIEAGKLDLERIPIDIAEVTSQVVALYQPQADVKGLILDATIANALPARVFGDPTRLRQVLANLISNAVKFTNSGEVQVVVSAENGTSAAHSSSTVAFTVRDTGIGMSKSTVEALFDPFTQGDASTTRRFGGTGLGLAICHQLTTLMGGSITVTSEEGVGTSFTVELPMEAVEATSHHPGVVDVPDSAAVRALLVTSDGDVTHRLTGLLLDWGFSFQVAATAAAAQARMSRAKAANRPFDAVLIGLADHQDAIELRSWISQDPDLDATSVVRLAPATEADAGSASEPTTAGPNLTFDHTVTTEVDPATLRQILLSGPVGIPTPEPPERPNPTEIDPAQPTQLRGRVLLVEDNRVNQRVGTGMLGRLGLAVAVAADGLEAVQQVSSEHFDAVLMDCQMPGMDGFEATREIRRREGPGEHIPIIATTADVMVSTVVACREAGMDEYLPKPYKFAELEAALRPWLDVAAST